MPELPEVETVVRDLRPMLVGRAVVGLELGGRKLRRPWDAAWSARVVGQRFEAVRRRGKWILLDLHAGPRLVVHLGMTGQFTVTPAARERPDHLHVVFALDDGHELRFRDIRRFGSVELLADEAAALAYLGPKLGPEPFDIPAGHFHDAVTGTGRTLKAILLDQTVVAGVGNIYADEALHRAGLHPETRGQALTRPQVERLRAAVTAVIAHAIEGRGSTIRDYVGGSGLRGNFQKEFRVYGRTGEACPGCGHPVEMVRVAGRASHHCPACQPPTKAALRAKRAKRAGA